MYAYFDGTKYRKVQYIKQSFKDHSIVKALDNNMILLVLTTQLIKIV